MNFGETERRLTERMKKNYPLGTSIVLLKMGDDPRPVEDNTRDTVIAVDDIGTLLCSFDNVRYSGFTYTLVI